MFDLGWGELVVIGIVALIAIGPKELPTVLRTVGQMLAKVRRMAMNSRASFRKPCAKPTSPISRRRRRHRQRCLEIRSAERGAQGHRKVVHAARRPDGGPGAVVRHAGGSLARANGINSRQRHHRRRKTARGRIARDRCAAPDPPPAFTEKDFAETPAASVPDSEPPKQAGGKSASHEDIEATKAPLMEHLIELRSRLIKALIAFAVAFGLCFIFAKDIYNILVWPFVWVAGAENSKFIYTALLEYFITQLKLAMFGAAFLAFPVIAGQIYMFVAPGLYRNERRAFLPYLVATPFFFALGATVVYFLVLPMLIRFSLGMQQSGTAERGLDRAAARRSANICR